MTKDEITKIVEEAVEKTLQRLGIDVSEPIEMQKDFALVRSWRQSTEAVRHKGLMTMIGILIAGTAGALWLGIKELLHVDQ
ncbi:MAG: hypothetical protein L0Y60_04365 [Beijerinckiaceae bacterium]|nr:hypothetical protein [Beijerinckiaceae bacterium]